jgi:hypothetical protein
MTDFLTLQRSYDFLTLQRSYGKIALRLNSLLKELKLQDQQKIWNNIQFQKLGQDPTKDWLLMVEISKFVMELASEAVRVLAPSKPILGPVEELEKTFHDSVSNLQSLLDILTKQRVSIRVRTQEVLINKS